MFRFCYYLLEIKFEILNMAAEKHSFNTFNKRIKHTLNTSFEQDNIMNAEQIAEKARKSIGKYCIEECKAYCCRKGYLVLEENEVDTITQGKRKELEEKGRLKKIKDGRYSLYMGNSEFPCPSQGKDNKCMIYKKRTQTCKDFPVFIEGKDIRLSPRCLAVRNGKLYPYERMFIAAGYKLMKCDEYGELELGTIELK